MADLAAGARSRQNALSARPQLADDVADYLRDMIMSGLLREGHYIRLDRIASELGISNTPVREALLALRLEGFVALEPRRGFVVQTLSRSDIVDLFQIQAHIAGELTARAAAVLTSEDLDHLEAIQQRLVDSVASEHVVEIDDLNHEFHRFINTAANAPKLTLFLRMAMRYVPRRFFASVTGWPQASVDDHTSILAALRAGDAETARAAMTRHIVHAGELLADHRMVMALDPEADSDS